MSRYVAILIAAVSLSLSVGIVIGQTSAPTPATAATAQPASADTSILRSIDRRLGSINDALHSKASAGYNYSAAYILHSLTTSVEEMAADIHKNITYGSYGVARYVYELCHRAYPGSAYC